MNKALVIAFLILKDGSFWGVDQILTSIVENSDWLIYRETANEEQNKYLNIKLP